MAKTLDELDEWIRLLRKENHPLADTLQEIADGWRADVEKLTDDQWCVSQVECFDCGKEWTAVHPLGTGNLECPECGSDDTARFEPMQGKQ